MLFICMVWLFDPNKNSYWRIVGYVRESVFGRSHFLERHPGKGILKTAKNLIGLKKAKIDLKFLEFKQVGFQQGGATEN